MSATTTEARADGEAREAAAGGSGKRAYVRRIFSEIAPRYDLLNHLLSANIDRGWRRRAIDAMRWETRPAGRYLDLCAGTMDLAAELARRPGFAGSVLAADFAEPMLRSGASKAGPRVTPVVGDALRLPLADAVVDGAVVGFGVRNFDDLDAGLTEVYRVLAPGRRLVVLEFSTPPNAVVRAAYGLYSLHVLPFVGGVVSGHRSAYRYLPRSVAVFPDAPALGERMRQAGFVNVGWRLLTAGIAAIHWGERAA